MQAVPFTAFTTKSFEPGKSVKSVPSSSYGIRKESPARQNAFSENLRRAARDLNGSGNEASMRKPVYRTGQNVNEQGTKLREQTPSHPAAKDNSQAGTPDNSEAAVNLRQKLLEILQLLGFINCTQLTGQPQTEGRNQAAIQNTGSVGFLNGAELLQTTNSALAELVKAMTGKNGNLKELLEQMQTDLQQLVQQFNEKGESLIKANDLLSMVRDELLKSPDLTGSDALTDEDLLAKVAGVLAKIAEKTAAAGKTQVDLNISTASAADQSTLSSVGGRNAGNTPAAGDNPLAGKVETNAVNQTEAGGVGSNGQNSGNYQKSDANGLATANELSSENVQSGANPTKIKSTETIPTDAKQTEAKPTEAEQTGAKQTVGAENRPLTKDAGIISVNSDQGQAGFRLQVQSNPGLQNNVDMTQAQSFKMPNQPVSIPRMSQIIFGQITQKAKLLMTPGATEMQIQLKPDYLGKMNLSITSENGLVTARFNTESYRIKEVIEANLNTLKDNLAQQGVKVDQLVVNVSTQKEYSGFQEQNNSYYHNSSNKSGKTDNIINEEGYEKLFAADLESKSSKAYYGNTVDFKA